MGIFFDIITILLSIFFLSKSIKKIRKNLRSFVYIMFFIIYILPLFLDYIIGIPDYNSWYTGATFNGFIISYTDTLTRILYDVFLIFTQYILVFYKNKAIEYQNGTDNTAIENYSLMKIALIIFSFLPIILIILSSIDNRILYEFGWREKGDFFAKVITSNALYFSIEKLSYVGLACSFINVIKCKNIFNKLVFILLMYCNICIESKRSIIFLALFFFIYYLISNSKIKIKKIAVISIFVCVLIIGIGLNVKSGRGYETMDSMYATLRVDFFRDDRVKMTLYSMVHPDELQILNYPGESYIKQIGYIFPLDFLKFDRIGYNTYFTSALIGTNVELGNNFMTTSICDEVFSNFKWLGFIINPFILVYISNFIEKRNRTLKYFGVIGVILTFMYSLNYIMWYLELFIFFIMLDKILLKKKEEIYGEND